ncbi:dTDP-4-dehydrorhamnose 3,5-epimerase [Candidatus Omnitrophota bacterium]
MPSDIEQKFLNGGIVLKPQVFHDERGYFMEVCKNSDLKKHGISVTFVQENQSYSKKGTLRGLHFQYDKSMAKLMRVTQGKAFLVAVDIRKCSPTLGQWFGLEVSCENKLQVYTPAGFARGFCSLSNQLEIQYLCSAEYNKNGESAIYWNDSAIGIQWPIADPILSEKDKKAESLEAWLRRPESEKLIFGEKK